MFVSIRDALIQHAGFDSVVDGLKDLDLACVEIQVGSDFDVKALDGTDASFNVSTDEGIADFRNHLTDNSILICAFLLANDFNCEDPEAEIAWVCSVVESAAKFGISTVRIDSAMTGQRELGFDERVRIFANAMTTIVAETVSTDVNLGIENHGFQGNNPKFLDAVIETVGSPRVGLTLDTGNFYWSGIPLSKVYETIEHFAPFVKHTHVKNINYPESEREKQREMGWEYMKYVSPLDEGNIDHVRVVDILRNADYNGDLTIEDESLGKFPENERKEILKRKGVECCL